MAGNEITRAGCWAHVRRKVIDAEKAAPEIAREAVAFVRTLYGVELQAKALSLAERLELRRDNSAPVLSNLHEKLLSWEEQLLPKHPMAEAVNYALGQWTELNVFCSMAPCQSTTTKFLAFGPIRIGMSDLFWLYACAAASIAGLILLAVHNRRHGWRRQRVEQADPWLDLWVLEAALQEQAPPAGAMPAGNGTPAATGNLNTLPPRLNQSALFRTGGARPFSAEADQYSATSSECSKQASFDSDEHAIPISRTEAVCIRTGP